MGPDYLNLAARRVGTRWPPYKHPEDFGYDFREWVSPYTKSAHATGGTAIVLQDWLSAEFASKGIDPVVQAHGRVPSLATNRRLDALLERVLGLDISDVYITNAFPFIKPGGMSAAIPFRDVVRAVETFTVPELELAEPKKVLALGSQVHRALTKAGVKAVALPHPAARGMSLDDHVARWRACLV